MCCRRVSCISIIASNHWKKMPYLKFCFLQLKRCFFFFIKLYHYKQFSGTFKICILKHSLKTFFILVQTKIVLTKIFFGAHLADSVCASFFCHEWKYQLHFFISFQGRVCFHKVNKLGFGTEHFQTSN